MEDQSTESSNLSGQEGLLPTNAEKTWGSDHFEVSFDDRSQF